MCWQPRIEHAADAAIVRQPLCELQRSLGLLANAELERFQAAAGEEALEGTHHPTSSVLQEVELVVERLLTHDERAAEQVAMAAEVFGGRMHHDIGAELQRAGEHGRGKCVINPNENPAALGD